MEETKETFQLPRNNKKIKEDLIRLRKMCLDQNLLKKVIIKVQKEVVHHFQMTQVHSVNHQVGNHLHLPLLKSHQINHKKIANRDNILLHHINLHHLQLINRTIQKKLQAFSVAHQQIKEADSITRQAVGYLLSQTPLQLVHLEKHQVKPSPLTIKDQIKLGGLSNDK